MASLFQALVHHIDGVRAVFEHLALDHYPDCSDMASILSHRDTLESAFIPYAPPSSPSARPLDSERWMRNLTDLIDSAADPSRQPHQAVPWF